MKTVSKNFVTPFQKSNDIFATIAIISLVGILSRPCAAQMSVTYGTQGLATLAYNGVTLIDTNANGQDAFTVYEVERKFADGSVVDKYSWDNGYTKSWDATNKILTWTYDWGTIKCAYTQPQSNRLTMTMTVTNTTASDTINGVNIFPLCLRFPNFPVGYDANTPHVGYTSDGPNVQIADYGSGALALCSDDVTHNLYNGFFTMSPDTANYKRYEIWTGSMPLSFQPPNYPIFNRPIAHGTSDTYTISLRFGASGSTGPSLAPDMYQNFTTAWPRQVNWTDHRSIAALFLATSQTHPATNPRGWFGNDPNVDTTTSTGIAALQQRLLQYADNSIAIMQNMNSQGMIVWDVEGQQYPHATSYIGDPTLLSQMAPEMDGIANAFFKKFTDAGFRVGVCIRPQQLVSSPSVQQTTSANPAALLISKINYARQRWGCTIFYIDSNGDTNAPFDASIFKQVADAEPGVMLIPEHSNVKYYAYTTPYGALTNGMAGTPQAAIWTYPSAFSAIYTADGDLTGQHSTLVQSVQRGDVLMYRGWWNDPQNSQVQGIYAEAGVGAPVITSAASASGTAGSAFSYQVTANNGPASFSASGLPSGLSINASTGLISGTPTVSGTATVTLGASNFGGTGSKTLTITITGSITESPYGGTRWAIPGQIEAENYDLGGQGLAYNDSDAGNTGGAYRSDNVDIRTVVSDTGGGYQVGWTVTGEYLKYMVNVTAAGTYDFQVREANGGSASGTVHLEVDGTNVTGAMTLPTTGGWDTFSTITKTGVTLTAGQHTIRVYEDVGGPDINWFKVVTSSPTATAFNVNALFTPGTAVTNGGADSYGNAYNSGLVGTTASFNSSSFTFGSANVLDAWSNLTVALTAGNYTTLNMLATGAGGIQSSKTFVVHYTDGTTQTFTKSLSDWRNPQSFAGETQVITMPSYLGSAGQSITGTTYIYGYTFALNGKSVQSITLPATRGVIAFGFAGR